MQNKSENLSTFSVQMYYKRNQINQDQKVLSEAPLSHISLAKLSIESQKKSWILPYCYFCFAMLVKGNCKDPKMATETKACAVL